MRNTTAFRLLDHGSEAAEQHGAATAVGTWRPVRRPVRSRSRYRIPARRAAGWISGLFEKSSRFNGHGSLEYRSTVGNNDARRRSTLLLIRRSRAVGARCVAAAAFNTETQAGTRVQHAGRIGE